MKRPYKAAPKKSRLSIVVAIAMVGLFGLTTNSALADSNETSSSSSNSYIQSSISAGGNSTCVVLNGAAKCWGANDKGQLGDASTTPSQIPVSVSGLTSGVTAISVGNNHACAVVSGGVKCWGANGSGQLGDASTTPSLIPVSVSGLTSGVTAISVGGSEGFMGNSSFSCAVVSGGVKCWGANGSGQLGDASTTPSQIPVSVSGLTSGVTAISVGDTHACAVVSGGVKCWGANYSGQLGNGTTSKTGTSTPASAAGMTSGVAAISLGFSHSCVVTSTALKCWGRNTTGQAGPTAFAATQVLGLTSGVTAISAGQYGSPHVCGIQAGSLKCWGYNSDGQLGNGSRINADTPQQVVGLTAGVTAVDGFTCAVVSGTAQCWGTGSFHRLQPQSSAPVEMHALSNVSAITGSLEACVVIAGGMKCWGSNGSGQLGIGSTISQFTPQQVVGLTSGVTSISSGSRSHLCAVASGTAQCWGWGEAGKLGIGSAINANTPQQVIGLTSGVTAISAGSDHSCAVVSGSAMCWGGNGYGQLGDGTRTDSSSPVQVTGLTSGVTAITAGENSTCAVADGALKCWGNNSQGELGDGTTNSSLTPVSVVGLSSGVTAITLSRKVACAIKDGSAMCWGDNTYGALGNGSTGVVDYFSITTPQEIIGIGTLGTTTTTTVAGSTTSSTVAPKAVTTTIVVSAAATTSTIASTPVVTVAQGQVSVATIAPNVGPTTTLIPQVVTTVAGAPVAVAPDAPAVAPGEVAVVTNGLAVATTITRAVNQITAMAGDISTTLSGLTSNGKRVALNANGNLVLNKGQRLLISAAGFEVGRDVAVWMYSIPTQLGIIETLEDGTISGVFNLPPGLDVGDHRLVLESKKSDSQTTVIAFGFSYASSNSSSAVPRVLIAIPIAFAVLFGLFLPAISRRRKRQVTN
jgi:alpha-tubulin suppressor-like RCC1 family protein